MPLNDKLLAAIKDENFWNGKPQKEKWNKLLEEVIACDTTNNDTFRSIFLKDEYYTLLNTIDSTNFTTPKPANNSNFLLETDPTNPFAKIKQAAAEQRVKNSLANASSDVLINILKHNGAECRNYIKTQIPKLSASPQWDSQNQDILTNDALKKIKTVAAQDLLFRMVKSGNITDPKLFDDLIKADGNLAQVQEAAKKIAEAVGLTDLDFITGFTTALDQNLPSSVKNEANQRFNKIKYNQAMTALHSVKIKDEELLNLDVNILKHTKGDDFLDALLNVDPYKLPVGPHKPTFDAQTNKAEIGTNLQKKLCAQYLQADLKQGIDNDQKRVNVLNADKAALENALTANGVTVDTKIIKTAIVLDPDNTAQFKIPILKKYIKDLGDANERTLLSNLQKAENIERVRHLLGHSLGAKVGTADLSLDFLKPEHFKELSDAVNAEFEKVQRVERKKKFETLITDNARFGAKAHKALIDIFEILPDNKQADFLNKDKLALLLNAKNTDQFKYLLGNVDNKGSALNFVPLELESQRVALFKTIHNQEIAKVLIGLPFVDLNEDKVSKINKALKDAHATDISNKPDYINLFKKIHTECGIQPAKSPNFYNAFNLNDDASDLGAGHDVKNAIVAQYNKIKDIYEYDIEDKPATARLLEVFLRVGALKEMDESRIEKIREHAGKCNNVHEFIDKVVKPDPDASIEKIKYKAALKEELTPAVFREIKALNTQQNLTDHANAPEEIRKLHIVLERWKTSKSLFKGIEHQLKKIEQIDPKIHLNNPLFREEVRLHSAKMKKEYKELSQECDDTIVSIEKYISELEAKHDAVESALDNPPSPAVEKELRGLIKKLRVECNEAQELLELYQNAQKKIDNDILPAINNANAPSSKAFHGADAMVKSIPRDEVKDFKHQKKTTSGMVVSGDLEKQFLIEDIPKGEVCCVDLTHDYGPSKVFETRFVIDPDPPNKGRPITTMDGGALRKNSSAETRVLSFPDDRTPEGKKAASLAALEIARSILLVHGIPSEKNPLVMTAKAGEEKKLEYVWSALVILGEKSNMEFSPKALKFNVENTVNWHPHMVKTLMGYTEDSAYNGIKKFYQAQDKVEKISEGFDANKTKTKEITSVGEKTSEYRNKNQAQREKLVKHTDAAKKDIEAEGPRKYTQLGNN